MPKKILNRSLILDDKMPFRVDTCTFKEEEERGNVSVDLSLRASQMIDEISLRFFTRKFMVSLCCFSLSSFLFPELTSIP